MMVPERPSMAVARVMMTHLTPASMAGEGILDFGGHSSADSTVGLIFFKVLMGDDKITESSSTGLRSTPFFSNEKMRATS